MKFLVVLTVAVACAAAAEIQYTKIDEQHAPILRSEYESSPDGHFQFEYETGNGIAAQSVGVIKNPGSDTPTLEVKGSVKYNAPDGTPVSLQWTANEFGFQPTGSHIPVPPQVPEYILRGLAYIESHPPPAPSTFAKKL